MEGGEKGCVCVCVWEQCGLFCLPQSVQIVAQDTRRRWISRRLLGSTPSPSERRLMTACLFPSNAEKRR